MSRNGCKPEECKTPIVVASVKNWNPILPDDCRRPIVKKEIDNEIYGAQTLWLSREELLGDFAIEGVN